MFIQIFIKICAAILEYSAATAIFFSFPASDVENTYIRMHAHTHTRKCIHPRECVLLEILLWYYSLGRHSVHTDSREKKKKNQLEIT